MCILTPYFLGFPDDYSDPYSNLDTVISVIFAIDVFVNFFSAYHDQDFQIVDSRKAIALRYLASWFLIDVASVIPFD